MPRAAPPTLREGEGDAQGFLPGSSIQDSGLGPSLESDQAAWFDQMSRPPTATSQPPAVSHPAAAGPGDRIVLPCSAVVPQGVFSMRGSLMHVFVSYRVNTEGPEGNGMSGRVADACRAMSMDSRHQLKLPEHGW
jgi:hypothetical protein